MLIFIFRFLSLIDLKTRENFAIVFNSGYHIFFYVHTRINMIYRIWIGIYLEDSNSRKIMNHDLITDRIVRFLFHVFLFYLSVINNIPLKILFISTSVFYKIVISKIAFPWCVERRCAKFNKFYRVARAMLKNTVPYFAPTDTIFLELIANVWKLYWVKQTVNGEKEKILHL